LKHKSVKFTDALKEQAADWLRIEQLSPELISVEWKFMDIDGVILESIYQWIWDCKKKQP
jgi:IS30 family transposase